MTTQEIIDKHLKQFHEVQRLKVPIELNSYLHRMINEALHIHDVVGRSEQLKALFDGFTEWHQNEYGSVYVEIDQFSEYLQSL
jgi:hypothetical protein